MGAILTPAIDAIRSIQPDDKLAQVAHYSAMAVEAAAIKANGVPGYKPQHGPDSGECALTLDTLPVLVRYELIDDFMGGDVCEVVAVSICGHTIDAADFSNDIRSAWAGQCMESRIKAGWL